MNRAVMVAFVGILAACHVTQQHVASVDIPGPTQSARLELAEAVAARAWRGGLHEALKAEVPHLENSQLEEFEVRWVTLEGNNIAKVKVQCVLPTTGSISSIAERVVQECKRFIKDELERTLRARRAS